jgi:hypothetical protein
MNASVPKKMEHQSNEISEIEFDDNPFEPLRRSKYKFPIDPLALPGTIGDTVRWIVRSSFRP